jgi:hypothetical protein
MSCIGNGQVLTSSVLRSSLCLSSTKQTTVACKSGGRSNTVLKKFRMKACHMLLDNFHLMIENSQKVSRFNVAKQTGVILCQKGYHYKSVEHQRCH